MPRIYVAFSGLLQVGEQCKAIGNRVDAIQSDFQQTVRQLDWDIRLESDINRTAAQLSRKLDQYARSLKDCQRFLEDAHRQYVELDRYHETAKPPAIGASILIAENYPWNRETIKDVVPDTDDGVISSLKPILTWLDKLNISKEGGITKNALGYLESLTTFFQGEKKGFTGAGDLCELADSSVDLWTGWYQYFRDFYQGADAGIFGEVADRNVKILGVSGDFLGLLSSVLSASDGMDEKEWQSIVADYVSCGKEVVSVVDSGYELANLGKIRSLPQAMGIPWRASDVYSAIAKAGLSFVEQGFRSHEKYYADGKWDMEDTSCELIDMSMAGIYGLGHSLTFGLDDVIFGAIENLTGGDRNPDMTYAEKAAEGYRILARKCCEWWRELTK